jgi:hypothetical protein
MLIGVIIFGLGLVIAVGVSLTPYVRQAPINAPIVNVGTPSNGVSLAFPGAPIGDGYAIFSAPGTSQVQLPNYPYSASLFGGPAGSSVFIGGYFVASAPINFTITSLLPGNPVIFSGQNVQAMGFLTPNAYFPWFFQIKWENSNNEPLIVVGENLAVDPITPLFTSLNPSFLFAVGLIAIGLLVLGVGFFEPKMENEKLKSPESYGSFSEILDTSWATWKAVFSRVTLPFAILTALQIIIISIARNIYQLVTFEINSTINPIYSSLNRNYLLLQIIIVSAPIIYYLVVLFSFLLILIAEGVVIKYSYGRITESGASLKGSLKTAVRYSGKLLGVSILIAMILVAGLLVFVVPGIYLAVILSLIFQVIIIEEMSITQAISRSVELTHGRRLDTLKLVVFGGVVIILVLLLCYLVASYLAPTVPTVINPGDYFNTSSITSFVNFLPSIIGFGLIIGAITAITIPFFNIVMTVWYLHLNKQESQPLQTPKEESKRPKRFKQQEEQKQRTNQ